MSTPLNELETRLFNKLDGVQLREALSRMRALPRYAEDWERRLAAIGPDHNAIDVAIDKLRTMRDPLKCPEEWLFLLAWDLSVDVWDSDWPVLVKRRVCQASWIIHRFRGTRFAIEEGLKALGMTVRLKAWHEFDPPKPRGTFEAVVYVNENIFPKDQSFLTERKQNLAVESITRNKPLTRHFTLELGAGYKNKAGVGSAFAALLIDHETINAGRNTCFEEQIGVGNSLAALGVQHKTIEADRKRPIQSALTIASAFSGFQIMHAQFAA